MIIALLDSVEQQDLLVQRLQLALHHPHQALLGSLHRMQPWIWMPQIGSQCSLHLHRGQTTQAPEQAVMKMLATRRLLVPRLPSHRPRSWMSQIRAQPCTPSLQHLHLKLLVLAASPQLTAHSSSTAPSRAASRHPLPSPLTCRASQASPPQSILHRSLHSGGLQTGMLLTHALPAA